MSKIPSTSQLWTIGRGKAVKPAVQNEKKEEKVEEQKNPERRSKTLNFVRLPGPVILDPELYKYVGDVVGEIMTELAEERTKEPGEFNLIFDKVLNFQSLLFRALERRHGNRDQNYHFII